MVDDRVKIFHSISDYEIEDKINEWLEDNPDYYIRDIKVRKDVHHLTWHGFVWYTKINLEEERL